MNARQEARIIWSIQATTGAVCASVWTASDTEWFALPWIVFAFAGAVGSVRLGPPAPEDPEGKNQ